MPGRRGMGVLPSPTGGGLTGAMQGFLQVREMAQEARLNEERHSAQMSAFSQQLRAGELGELATRLEMLSNVAGPGQKLSDLAPDFAGELGGALGIEPGAIGDSVLRPYGPEHIMAEGVKGMLENYTPEELARYTEAASLGGRTLEGIQQELDQGRFASAVATAQSDWIKHNPQDFREAIAQSLGPEQMYNIGVFGHQIELSGQNAADVLLRMQQVIDARSAGLKAPEEARGELITWVRDIADGIGVTAPIPLVNALVDTMTDPELSPEDRENRLANIAARSPEMGFLVEATLDGRELGTSVLENIYRDDPLVGPMLNFLTFVEERLDAFPAAERTRILNALSEPIKNATGVGFSTTLFGRPRISLPDPGDQAAAAQRRQQQMGVTPEAMNSLIEATAQELGMDPREVQQQLMNSGVLPRGEAPPPRLLTDVPPAFPEDEPTPGAESSGDPVSQNLLERANQADAQIETMRGRLSELESAVSDRNIAQQLFPEDRRPDVRVRQEIARLRREISEQERLSNSWKRAARSRSPR